MQAWQPTHPASIIVPAFNAQAKLDLTLASLAQQDYPAALMEVIVVDDGSQPPVRVPDIAPENLRILRLERVSEWGPGRARHAGAQAAEGEILLFLDADMVAYPEHLRAHARWHHVVREAVTLGHKLFVDFDGITPRDVFEAAATGAMFDLAGDRNFTPHEWVEQVIERTNLLTEYEPTMFVAAVTATIGMRADFYREAGGFRTHMRTGEDMEMAYRLMAAGGVFIPEREARSWHQGPATFMSKAAEVRRKNEPYFSNYVPIPGGFRPWTPNRQYAVPQVDVVIVSRDTSFEATKRCVDAVLAGDEFDLRVDLCCPTTSEDVELVEAEYKYEPRVKVRTDVPATGFPSNYTMFLPEWAGLGPDSLGVMLNAMEENCVGIINAVTPGVPAEDGRVVLWRTAALHRARRAGGDGEDPEAIAARLFGEHEIDARDVRIVDLRAPGLSPLPKQRPSTASVVRELKATKQELRATRQKLRTARKQLRRLQGEKRHVAQPSPAGGSRREPTRRWVLQVVRKRLRGWFPSTPGGLGAARVQSKND